MIKKKENMFIDVSEYEIGLINKENWTIGHIYWIWK